MRNQDCAGDALSIKTHPSRLLLGALLATAGVLSARPAHADGAPQVFPLVVTSRLPTELNGTPEALTSALVTLLDGEIPDRSLEAFGKKLRCDIEISTCLDRVARSLGTNQLVYGSLLITVDGKVKVKLVRFNSARTGSELYQRTFTLSASTPRRLGKQLVRASAKKMFGREVTEEGAPTPPAPTPTPPAPTPTPPAPTPTPAPAPTTEPTEPAEPTEPTPPIITTSKEPGSTPAQTADKPPGGRITNGTWALIGSGALLAAGGSGFLYSASDLRDQIRTAPRATVDDLRRLTDLERAHKLRDQIGLGLAVGGGALLAVGVMRAIAQRDSAPQESSPALSLVPVSGGAAVVFSGNLR